MHNAIEALRKGLPGVKLHDVGHFKGFHAAGKAVVVVCVQEGPQLVLFHTAPHDEGYNWGKRHKFTLVHDAMVLRTLKCETASDEQPGDFVAPIVPKPLKGLRTKDLGLFGVPERAAAYLLDVPDEECLFELTECFKPALGNALLDLWDEPDALDKVLRDFEDYNAVADKPVDLSTAIANPRNAHLVWSPPQSEQGLLAALQGDFEAWRVFLHPSQRRVVERNTKGAFKLSGGPGTGKTVVAVHRARHLAEHVFADDPRKILLVSFSNALAAELRSLLERLCADKPSLLARFEVQTLSGTAKSLLEKAGISRQLLSNVEDCWKAAMAAETLGLPESFYRSEREHVVIAQGAWNRTQYVQVRRTGRSLRLSDRKQRLAVMAVLEAFEAAMLELHGGDDAALAREATVLLRSGKLASPYAAVICDELQDAGAAQLRMLAALTADADEGKTRPNALFLCGDGHQRLYTSPVSLKQCGIDIVGRSASLKLNYRTTEGIRRHAMGLVEGLEADALEQETGDSLSSYRSLRGGPPPVEHKAASLDEEAEWIASLVSGAEAAPSLLLVLARTKDYLQQLKARLVALGQAPRLLEANESLTAADRLVLCTLHRSKGLEAPRVVIAGAQLIPARYPGKGDDSDRALWGRKETCLLYVGLTRARDWCAVSRVG
ncbi:MAG: UvrD-helicase domain-containing protein [Myxococcota bacterium]|nr:UvrD-helicase domain-containing protein [Myxococcota bacterium]